MQGLILGFDGVLVDERPVQAEVLRQIFTDEGLAAAGERAVASLTEKGAGDLPSLIQASLEPETEAPLGLAARLAARWSAFYHMRIRREGPRAAAGAVDMVTRASDAGWMLGVLSPSPQSEIEGALEALGIRRHFKDLAGDAEVSADSYRQSWRALNSQPPLPSRLLHPHEVLAVDSSPLAMAAAAEAGLVAVGVAGRYSAEQLPGAERVIDDLQELFSRTSRR
ncbi:MAG: HAD family hydrolase [Acidobacteriota bacterium]